MIAQYIYYREKKREKRYHTYLHREISLSNIHVLCTCGFYERHTEVVQVYTYLVNGLSIYFYNQREERKNKQKTENRTTTKTKTGEKKTKQRLSE